MKLERALSRVVLPAPVPPETITFNRAPTTPLRKSIIGWVSGLAFDQILGTDAIGAKPADGQDRSIERQRRNHRVDARAILQARIDHRARLVNATTDHAHDALDDAEQVRVVLEHHVGLFEAAFFLDVDLVVAIDQDVGDVGVLEQQFQRPEPEDLVQHVGDQAVALEQAERRRLTLAIQQADDQAPNLGLGVLALDPVQALEVEPAEQFLMDTALESLIVRVADVSCGR